jgi:hypothetical protein
MTVAFSSGPLGLLTTLNPPALPILSQSPFAVLAKRIAK